MPFSDLARSIQHYPRHYPYLSRLENTRRASTSLSSYRRALELACLSLLPTPTQRTMLYLPRSDEHLSHLAWQTSVSQGNHTNALIAIPREFTLLLTATGDHSSLPQRLQFPYLVARRTSGAASATMRISFSARCVDVADCEWIGGTDLENRNLRYAETILVFPFSDTNSQAQNQAQTQLLQQWPGGFSDWVDNTLCEFAAESKMSAWKHDRCREVWDRAARAAQASVATCITDEEVESMLVELSACAAVERR